MSINYSEENARLDNFKPDESSEFWRPVAGQHKVKALNELEEAEPYREEGKEDKPQAKIKLFINGEEKVWTMSKGKSPASTFGQLCRLAKQNNNILKDIEFTVVVVNDGNRNSYTIVG